MKRSNVKSNEIIGMNLKSAFHSTIKLTIFTRNHKLVCLYSFL